MSDDLVKVRRDLDRLQEKVDAIFELVKHGDQTLHDYWTTTEQDRDIRGGWDVTCLKCDRVWNKNDVPEEYNKCVQ